MIIIGISVLLLGLVLSGPIISNVEHPKYDVVSTHKTIEIRSYAPKIIAEVTVEGERDEAINKGFKLIADYIFGNNSMSGDIAMTAPVTQQSTQQQSQKIAMTAPVTQSAFGDNWRVHFVMPSEYTLETLPKPNNDKVTLKQMPAKKIAAIQFSGTSSDDNMLEHEQKLMLYLKDHNIKALSTPSYAFYNAPWTLPLLRRNEVMIEIE